MSTTKSTATKSPKEMDISEKRTVLHKGVRNIFSVSKAFASRGPKARVVITYKDQNDREVKSEEMSKNKINSVLTKLLNGYDDLVKEALAAGSKGTGKQNKSRISIKTLNPQFVSEFGVLLDAVAQDPEGVKLVNLHTDIQNALGSEDYIPVSVKLISNLVRLYVYMNGLHTYEGNEKMTKSKEIVVDDEGNPVYNKSNFQVDGVLSDLMRVNETESVEVGTILQQIQIASRIKHLLVGAPEDWTYEEAPEKAPESPNMYDRIDRYNVVSDSLRKEMMKEAKKAVKKGEIPAYPEDVEAKAVQKVLSAEEINVRGTDLLRNGELLSDDLVPLWAVAAIDYLAESVDSVTSAF